MSDEARVYVYIVVGGGPAGLQLGYFFERAGQDYLILEAGEGMGTFFQTFPRYFVVALPDGPDYADYPFEFERFIQPHEAHLNSRLHPVIQRFDRGTPVSELHLLEEPESRWTDPCHRCQVVEYLQAELAAPRESVSAGVTTAC
jgi:cation diffusion facilitator CzcD-associated flavoprotein CzcO